MLNTFSKDLGGGFNVGCHIEITLKNSTLRPLVAALNYKSLINAFHGHAHNRLCQLPHLATYMKCLGTEDLGVCESTFSKSNDLGGVIWYKSIFHHMQAIVQYFNDIDHMETYQNLSKWISTICFGELTTPQQHFFITTTNRHGRSSTRPLMCSHRQ
jgi:hypothetical protein